MKGSGLAALKTGHPELLLIDLPTFPKGVLSLSLFAVAASLKKHFSIRYVDLNLKDPVKAMNCAASWLGNPSLVGIKVSAQNFGYAKNLTAKIREQSPDCRILWGGEFPTLLPQDCATHCDTIVSGQFESVAADFVQDYKEGVLKKYYHGTTPESLDFQEVPDFSIAHLSSYYSFMGFPLETSRGCTQHCVFCMVHVMQKNYLLKSPQQLEKELASYKGRFVNVIDYNIGVEPQHVITVSRAMKKAKVAGWMAEMCIESLDNDAMLHEMRSSGCRMIYCGIESIEESALLSVNKAKINKVSHYERIIRKVQSYGIQIAGGVILGLKGSDERMFEETYRFFHRVGIIYSKLTFLTYNPGTKVHASMKRVGAYLTTECEKFDGNHFTFLPQGVEKEQVLHGAEKYIRKFYSLKNIVLRSFHVKMNFSTRVEFITFSYCYGEVYRQWLKKRIFSNEAGFQQLLLQPHHKTFLIKIAERMLEYARRKRGV